MIEKVITVPVEYTATAEDVVMTGEKANEARLHLSGAKFRSGCPVSGSGGGEN